MAITEQAQAEIDNRFTFHPVKEGQAEIYQDVRAIAKEFAEFIVSEIPAGREQAVALAKLDEVVFWANAAVARGK